MGCEAMGTVIRIGLTYAGGLKENPVQLERADEGDGSHYHRERSFWVSPTRRSVVSLLEQGLDQQPLPETAAVQPSLLHENIRGPDYYQ